MTYKEKITKVIYQNSTDTSDSLCIKFGKVEGIIDELEALIFCEVNSTFTEYEKQVSINCIELIAQNKDKYVLDEGVLYLVELVEKYTVVPINQP